MMGFLILLGILYTIGLGCTLFHHSIEYGEHKSSFQRSDRYPYSSDDAKEHAIKALYHRRGLFTSPIWFVPAAVFLKNYFGKNNETLKKMVEAAK